MNSKKFTIVLTFIICVLILGGCSEEVTINNIKEKAEHINDLDNIKPDQPVYLAGTVWSMTNDGYIEIFNADYSESYFLLKYSETMFGDLHLQDEVEIYGVYLRTTDDDKHIVNPLISEAIDTNSDENILSLKETLEIRNTIKDEAKLITVEDYNKYLDNNNELNGEVVCIEGWFEGNWSYDARVQTISNGYTPGDFNLTFGDISYDVKNIDPYMNHLDTSTFTYNEDMDRDLKIYGYYSGNGMYGNIPKITAVLIE